MPTVKLVGAEAANLTIGGTQEVIYKHQVVDLTDAEWADVPTAKRRVFEVLGGSSGLATGANFIGYTSPGPSLDAAQGKLFLAGTGRLTLTAAGNVRELLRNPAGSGKNLLVIRLSGMATAVAWARLRVNPTTGLPATAARPINNAIIGSGIPAVGVFTGDTDLATPLGGGTDTGIDLGIPGGQSRFQVDLPPLIIPPGNSMGVNIPFAGSADVSMSVYWIEK